MNEWNVCAKISDKKIKKQSDEQAEAASTAAKKKMYLL